MTRKRVSQAVSDQPSQRLSQPASQKPALENQVIRQDLLPLCTYHEYLAGRGISEETCDALGIGYLAQGRSPLKGRIVFQVADGRVPKSGGDHSRVILSHIGRAVTDGQEPKYLFYEGFHKSAELYGQEICWLHEDSADQIAATGAILLTEGPFDLAKAYEAGLRNVVASFGASLATGQALRLKALADHHSITCVTLVFDRDEAGRKGAAKAAITLSDIGLKARIFDWDAPIANTARGVMRIPDTITDLADLNTDQIAWLRAKGKL